MIFDCEKQYHIACFSPIPSLLFLSCPLLFFPSFLGVGKGWEICLVAGAVWQRNKPNNQPISSLWLEKASQFLQCIVGGNEGI